VNESARNARQRVPRWTRTDRDWVMIVLGVILIVFFVAAGYAAVTGREDGTQRRKRGPVKDPKASAVMEHRTIANNGGLSAWTISRGIGGSTAGCAVLS